MKNIIDILTFQAKGGLWERILRFLEPFLMQHAIVPIKFGLYLPWKLLNICFCHLRYRWVRARGSGLQMGDSPHFRTEQSSPMCLSETHIYITYIQPVSQPATAGTHCCPHWRKSTLAQAKHSNFD